jgi:cytosine/adenosine deaminase-related metal-dependent hydrolase
MHDPIAVKPRWVLPMLDGTRTNGLREETWIVIRDGIIVDLTNSRPDSIPRKNRFDRPDWILLPGFFNSHCHLEFSDLQSPFPASKSFAEWIGAVVKHRMQFANDLDVQRSRAIQSGILEAWSTGTRFVLDTVTSPWKSQWISQAIDSIPNRLSPLARCVCGDTPIRVVPCVEVLDINQTRKEETFAFYKRLRSQYDSVHISPHAPYTTSNQFVKEAVSLANQSNAIISMHLAESKEEMEWLANRQGPFQTRLAPFRDATFDLERSMLSDYLLSLGTADRLLIAHGNYLTESELTILTRKNISASIVHCPRTYRHFHPEGRDAYPIVNRQTSGVQHFLGTDSRASNPDLSMWREFQCVAKDVDNDASTIDMMLGMMTTAPAHFFHQADLGCIQPGASALLNCISNPQGWPDTPEQLLLCLANTPLHPSPLELLLT